MNKFQRSFIKFKSSNTFLIGCLNHFRLLYISVTLLKRDKWDSLEEGEAKFIENKKI